METQKQLLNNVLQTLGINAECINVGTKRNIRFFDLKLIGSDKISKIESYSREIGLGLMAHASPTTSVIHKLGVIRLKVPVDEPPMIDFDTLYSNSNQPAGILPFLVGESVDSGPVWLDMAMLPHLLVAGTTGSGKSSFLHVLIANAMKREDVDLFLVDPKGGVEFYPYKEFATTIAFSYNETISVLDRLLKKMEDRYNYLLKAGISSIEQRPNIFNKTLLIIDEVSDLMIQDSNKNNPFRGQFESKLIQLAQKGRAAGIYIVAATQRPSADILTGLIKANFPARVACKVSSGVESRIILDADGAENLLGRGDAIVNTNKYSMERFQVAFVKKRS